MSANNGISEGPPPPSGPTFFRADSPINSPIPTDTAIAADSAAFVRRILHTKLPLLGYGSSATRGGDPIYRAAGGEPRHTVVPRFSDEAGGDWGPNFLAGFTVPWDPDWTIPGKPTKRQDDKWVVVLDVDGTCYELWQTTFSHGRLACWWGCRSAAGPTDGIKPVAGRGTGADLSRIAGMITTADWAAGTIRHALVFSGDYCRGPATEVDQSGNWVYPASATDGAGPDSPAYLEQGTRIRLDPAYVPEQDPGLRPYEAIVARALIDYGAYLEDNAGEGTTFSCGRYPTDGSLSEPAVRHHVGLPDADWPPLDNIPWRRYLQVLEPTPVPSPLHY